MWSSLIKDFWIPGSITILVWLLVGIVSGPEAFVLVVILTLLEMTLSADNAVVNSRVLITMSPFWQRLFMTVGIFIAVFVIRFTIPIVIVAMATPLDAGQTLRLAIDNPTEYGHKLEQASPVINAFGGIFLSLVAIFFFVDKSRSYFWIRPVEKSLAKLGRIKFIRLGLSSGLILSVYLLAKSSPDIAIIGAAVLTAAAVYAVLHGAVLLMQRINKDNKAIHKVGWAAFTAFLYLEVLDASFSLDGVVGAFALTNNVVIIMAGLGVGAIWVRSMTLHMTKSNTLLKYRYLESGAHWAIVFLAMILLFKLFHIELPELVVGTVGLICIGLSIYSSQKENKKSREF